MGVFHRCPFRDTGEQLDSLTMRAVAMKNDTIKGQRESRNPQAESVLVETMTSMQGSIGEDH